MSIMDHVSEINFTFLRIWMSEKRRKAKSFKLRRRKLFSQARRQVSPQGSIHLSAKLGIFMLHALHPPENSHHSGQLFVHQFWTFLCTGFWASFGHAWVGGWLLSIHFLCHVVTMRFARVSGAPLSGVWGCRRPGFFTSSAFFSVSHRSDGHWSGDGNL